MLHNNVLAHTSLLIRSYLAKHQTLVVSHPPYSPDLAPADFFLFPKLKTTLKEHCFQNTEEIQANAIRELRAITESAFQEAFQQCKKRWEQCIVSRGDYFEGDSASNAAKLTINSLQQNFSPFWNTPCIAMNDWMGKNKLEKCERNRSWPSLRQSSAICLDALHKK